MTDRWYFEEGEAVEDVDGQSVDSGSSIPGDAGDAGEEVASSASQDGTEPVDEEGHGGGNADSTGTLALEPSEGRFLLTTPLDEYSVTEGLLLIAVVFLALAGVVRLFTGRR